MGKEDKDFGHVKPSNVYDVYVTVPGPKPMTEQAHSLHSWLSAQHGGEGGALPAPEHDEAARRADVSKFCPIRLVLQRDGRYVPETMEVDGIVYDLVPRIRTPAPSSR